MISERIKQTTTEKEMQVKKMMKGKNYRSTYALLVIRKQLINDKLARIIEKAGIPETERKLIVNLYWGQHAAVRWDDEISREVKVDRGQDRVV